MPIGTPKIPFPIPEEKEPGWGEISHELFLRRIFFLFGNMTAEPANKVASSIIYFNQEDPTLDQLVFINSRGGNLAIGLGVYQAIRGSKANVTTIGLGIAAGMGCLALVGGNTRIGLPGLFVKMREPSHSPMFHKQAIDLMNELDLMMTMYNIILTAFSEKTGQPIEIIKEDMKNNTLMTATEAYAYGIIDQIGCDVREIMRSHYFDEEIEKREFDNFDE
uniref:ATP-dependent Clp protease proteolytic subunit 1 n=1 Tax=Orobanche coerulescens TaxID=223100 RepID=UPI00223731EC|nr:ATP-dependent Clp protease proteolytic subunit 1 [Orobanche coerulescens]UYR95026.1 ATP-dependent Clp protease proteolytic subunit 1 [Orobanche coerulescens]